MDQEIATIRNTALSDFPYDVISIGKKCYSGEVRSKRYLISIFSSIVLFGPWIAYVAGERGAPNENRQATNFNELSLSWNGFSTLSNFIRDRIPLRPHLIRIDSWIDQNIFHEDPAFGGSASPRIIHGKDGFLFLSDDFDMANQSIGIVPDVMRNIRSLTSAINKSGRETIFTVAPNKTTIYEKLLPDDQGNLDILKNYSSILRSALQKSNISGYIDLIPSLIDAEENSRESMYLRKDSHWNSAGSAAATKAVVNTLQPGLWDESALRYRGISRYTGDLTYLEGNPREDETPVYRVDRPLIVAGLAEVWDNNDPTHMYRRYSNDGPPGSLIEGKTLFIVDSFGVEALGAIVPYFAEITFIHIDSLNDKQLVAAMNDADRIWIMAVERLVSARFSDPPISALRSISTPEFRSALDYGLTQKVIQ